jgi:hypothetical protein
MINKKNLLGKTPDELGTKDAIHVAIVAVRAGSAIKPGQRCKMNEHREAVPDSEGEGVADPFVKDAIATGQSFWLLLNQDAVPNVQHVWEHPTIDFAPPAREVKRNRAIEQTAKAFGVTYEQVLEAADKVVSGKYGYDEAPYPGTLTAEEFRKVKWDHWDFWSEWADETFYEFENTGSGCCPEYDYPEVLFASPE